MREREQSNDQRNDQEVKVGKRQILWSGGECRSNITTIQIWPKNYHWHPYSIYRFSLSFNIPRN